MPVRPRPSFFPSAPLPDVLLGGAKDGGAIRSLTDAIRDVSSEFLASWGSSTGERLVPLIGPEISLLSRCAFYGATLLPFFSRGMQGETIGDEACGMLVAGTSGAGLSLRKRWLLFALAALAPYIWTRVVVKQRGWTQIANTLRYRTAREQAEALMRRNRMNAQVSPADREVAARRNRFRARLVSFASGFGDIAAKIHQGLFFLGNGPRTMAERAAGARRVLTRPPDFPRPSYAVLGVFIFAQLALKGMSGLRRAIVSLLASVSANGNQASFAVRSVADVAVLSEDTTLPASSSPFKGMQCGVCLEAPTRPSCTRCGHVFCFECIISAMCDSGQTQCPTCRQPAAPNEIECIYLNHQVA